MNTKVLHLSLGMLLTASWAHAQTNFPEVEANDSKATAQVINCMVAGDTISGDSTGASTVTAGATSSDNFRVTICAAPLGVYRHTLALTSAGPVGHVGSIRGLTQTTGVINVGTDSPFQTSGTSSSTTPAVVFYGFGKAEELYYRVTGTATTTAGYVATLASTPISPVVVPGSFVPGTITVSTVGQTGTDTELYVYDSNLNPVPTFHNDDEGPAGPSLQSRAARTLGAGVYYVAIGNWNTANNQPDANPDEDTLNFAVLDFPNVMANSSTSANVDFDCTISDGVTTTPVTLTRSAFFGIEWAQFTVGTPAAFNAFCTNGSLGTDHTTPCPCGNTGLPGNGCGHSFDANGANLSATGTPSLDDVVLHSQFEPASSFTLMMQHANSGDVVFFDGVLCAANPLIRLRGRAAVGGEAFFPNSLFAQDSTTTLSIRGGTFPGSGQTMRYAAWYRNASTTFCPPATANVTNGWVIDW